MMHYRVCKGVSLRDGKPLEGASIEITEMLPIPEMIDDMKVQYMTDAQKIFNALTGSLPSGTLDALLVLLLQKKAEMLKYGKRGEG